MKTSILVALSAFASVQESTAWSSPQVSRRAALQKAAAFGSAAVLLPNFPAFADVTEETPRIVTRMGGLLEPYQDGTRGIRLMAPSGWNKVCAPLL